MITGHYLIGRVDLVVFSCFLVVFFIFFAKCYRSCGGKGLIRLFFVGEIKKNNYKQVFFSCFFGFCVVCCHRIAEVLFDLFEDFVFGFG